jgi:hypothetical protein
VECSVILAMKCIGWNTEHTARSALVLATRCYFSALRLSLGLPAVELMGCLPAGCRLDACKP